ncbi:MAG: adenylosuccinate synthase [Gemmatimonadetes bacterium]|nr:adenylosuccinate synthase [Gemmatimonadota bacterium]
MKAAVVVGAQWGDEGKAKVIDYLTERADIIARFQGGANAGHTVVVEGRKFVFHLVPSGVLYPDKICVIGNGVVVDPLALLDEIEQIRQRGIETEGRVLLSSKAHLILPVHKALDGAMERSKGERSIGTTGRGIGPAYSEKAQRGGIQAAELLDVGRLRERLVAVLERGNRLLERVFGEEGVEIDEVLERYSDAAGRLASSIRDTSRLLDEAMRAGHRVLLEGAQGTMLDIDHGTYPFVTSSNPTAGGACLGTGIGPSRVGRVVGIAKAYATRVGHGPFPTELEGEMGERLRDWGGEYGATTGRPRRCGWFDAVALRYAARVNGLDELAVTKLDVLDRVDEIAVCTGYRIDGRELDDVPLRSDEWEGIEPIYEWLPGWKSETSGLRKLEELPGRARAYLERIGALTGVPVGLVSVGPDRAQTLRTADHELFITG